MKDGIIVMLKLSHLRFYYMIKRIAVLLVFQFVVGLSYGQDAVFSQYYAAPAKSNPAFTGLTQRPLISLNYRNQWSGLNKAYVTYHVGYSQFYERAHSGLGLYVQADNAGNGLFVTSEAKVLYSYQLEPTKDIFLKLGTEIGAISNHVSTNKLLFPDDIDPVTGGGSPSETPEPSRTFLDIGAGILLYNQHFYVGYSMAHLNRPNTQLIDVSQKLYGGLPVRVNAQLGGQISLSPSSATPEKFYISPNIGWFKQSDFSQLDIDVFAGFGRFFAGVGYRHANRNIDALKLSAGMGQGIFKIGYSYDYTVSKLRNASAGSHEISLILNLDQSEYAKQKRKVDKYSDCFGLFR